MYSFECKRKIFTLKFSAKYTAYSPNAGIPHWENHKHIHIYEYSYIDKYSHIQIAMIIK